MKSKYDVIWYWKGGRSRGAWHQILIGPPTQNELEESIRTLNAAGFVNYPGTRSIGPPESPPMDREFVALGL